jgi:hypothetical protein
MRKWAKLTCAVMVLGGALVGLSGVAAADSPEVVLNPLPETCFLQFGTFAGHLPGALRFPTSGPPEVILICSR